MRTYQQATVVARHLAVERLHDPRREFSLNILFDHLHDIQYPDAARIGHPDRIGDFVAQRLVFGQFVLYRTEPIIT